MGSDLTAALVRQSGSSFLYSFSFLPKPQRDALKTVYAFCRTTDDIVDNPRDVQSKMEKLSRWRLELERALTGGSAYPLLNQLSGIARTFNIPVVHFHDLIRGVEMDLVKNRYATFEELREYCTLVASSVGLMCLEIFGPRNKRTRDYAVNLGIALQMTNVLRDVAADARYGRIYLPQEDLARFECREEDILAGRATPGFLRLMEFEVERAEGCFRTAQESLPREDRRAMFPAKIMERIYFHTLLRIKKSGFNVLDKSVTLPSIVQLLIALKYWVKDRLLAA